MFVGRKRELKKLEEMYQSGQFECAVFYGRRRVPPGKADPRHIPWRRPFNGAAQGDKLLTNEG